MSIVRVGLAETRNFSEGYDAIFGKKPKLKVVTPKSKSKIVAKTTTNRAKGKKKT